MSDTQNAMMTQEKEKNNNVDLPGISARTATILFWSIVCSFALVWAVLPAIFHTGYRNDVIELIFVGKEWVLANAKHPALTAWLAEIAGLHAGGAPQRAGPCHTAAMGGSAGPQGPYAS